MAVGIAYWGVSSSAFESLETGSEFWFEGLLVFSCETSERVAGVFACDEFGLVCSAVCFTGFCGFFKS